MKKVQNIMRYILYSYLYYYFLIIYFLLGIFNKVLLSIYKNL